MKKLLIFISICFLCSVESLSSDGGDITDASIRAVAQGSCISQQPTSTTDVKQGQRGQTEAPCCAQQLSYCDACGECYMKQMCLKNDDCSCVNNKVAAATCLCTCPILCLLKSCENCFQESHNTSHRSVFGRQQGQRSAHSHMLPARRF